MHLTADLLLLLATLAGGCVPLLTRMLDERRMLLLLAFSGAFLLGITCLHLLPETFADLPNGAGPYLLLGFFLQLLIQRATHGIEHGHVHIEGRDHAHNLPALSILAGLALHAFMEGIPLGFNYRNSGTNPSLFLAVGAHKLPEAMLLCMLLKQAYSTRKTAVLMLLFALITPCAALAATFLGLRYGAMARAVTVIIPIVAGSFIHIATTIFFESGTRQHALTRGKAAAMLVGLGIAALTVLFD